MSKVPGYPLFLDHEVSKIQKVAYQSFRKVLGASFEHSRYSMKFRLKSVHHLYYSTYHIAAKFLVINIKGKFAPNTFQVK